MVAVDNVHVLVFVSGGCGYACGFYLFLLFLSFCFYFLCFFVGFFAFSWCIRDGGMFMLVICSWFARDCNFLVVCLLVMVVYLLVMVVCLCS